MKMSSILTKQSNMNFSIFINKENKKPAENSKNNQNNIDDVKSSSVFIPNSQTNKSTQSKFFQTNEIDSKQIDLLIKNFAFENGFDDLYEEFKNSNDNDREEIVFEIKNYYELKERTEKSKIEKNALECKLDKASREIFALKEKVKHYQNSPQII